MLTVDISLPDIEELQKLVTEGQEKGFLSYDEIVAGLEEVDLTKEQVEDFYTYLIDHGIELVEGVEHKAPPHEQPALAEEEKAGPEARPDRRALARLAPALPARDRQGAAPHRRPGGLPRQAHRARRHEREDADDRGEPPPRRLDREGLPRSRASPSSTSSRRARSGSSARSRSSTTARATSSRPTRPGGSARRSRARSPTRRARSASRCTWSRS